MDRLERDRATRRKQRVVGVFILIAYLLMGSIFYTQVEGWTFGFAIYFCVVRTSRTALKMTVMLFSFCSSTYAHCADNLAPFPFLTYTVTHWNTH